MSKMTTTTPADPGANMNNTDTTEWSKFMTDDEYYPFLAKKNIRPAIWRWRDLKPRLDDVARDPLRRARTGGSSPWPIRIPGRRVVCCRRYSSVSRSSIPASTSYLTGTIPTPCITSFKAALTRSWVITSLNGRAVTRSLVRPGPRTSTSTPVLSPRFSTSFRTCQLAPWIAI